jgi:hypothetical protein
MTCQDRENVCESIIHSRAQVNQVRDKLNEQEVVTETKKWGKYINAKAITRSITEKGTCALFLGR